MSNGFFGRTGKGVAGAAIIATLSIGLAGCNNKEKEQIKTLTAENESLQERNATLDQGLRDKDSQISSLQSERDTLKAQAAQAQQVQPPTDSGTYARGNSSSGTVITVAGDALFDSGSVTVKASARKELDKVASDLKGRWSGHAVRVEGYTDKTPINKVKGKYPTNDALSQARAEAVEQYLISKGVSADRISAVGKGATKLKSTNAASRRVEIVVLGN